jgi:hypothetical protein
MHVVAKRAATLVKQRLLQQKNEVTAQLKIVRPFADLPNGSYSYTWNVFVDGALFLTLIRGDISKEQVLSVGLHSLRIEYDECGMDIRGPQGGARGSRSVGGSTSLDLLFGPGRYEFGLRRDPRSFRQVLKDSWVHNDSSARHPQLLSYRTWGDHASD